MNYNIIAYFIYISITAFIIIRVGKSCYTNGSIFVADLLPGQADICHKINQVLLLSYYLINIGYCATTLVQWNTIGNFQLLIETIAFRTSIIICVISVLHYLNIIIITNYIQKLIH